MKTESGRSVLWMLRGISREAKLLALVCLADLVSTVVLLQMGYAVEGNPLMDYFLRQYGMAAFCAAKLLFVIPPLAFAEWYRRRNDRLVRSTLRGVTMAYITIYVVWVVVANTLPA